MSEVAAIVIFVMLLGSLLAIAFSAGCWYEKRRAENNGISKEFVRELYFTFRHSFERGRKEGIREGERIKAETTEEPA